MTYEQSLTRYYEVRRLAKKGLSFGQIGNRFKITRQRAHQIFCKKPSPKSEPSPFWAALPKWKGEGRERARSLVRARDKQTCQSCKKEWVPGNRSFDVHHLNGLCGKKSRGYDSILDLTGLITLCHKCHFNHPQHTFRLRKKLCTPQHR